MKGVRPAWECDALFSLALAADVFVLEFREHSIGASNASVEVGRQESVRFALGADCQAVCWWS